MRDLEQWLLRILRFGCVSKLTFQRSREQVDKFKFPFHGFIIEIVFFPKINVFSFLVNEVKIMPCFC